MPGKRYDAPAIRAKRIRDATKTVSPPDGVVLKTKEQETLWDHFTRARPGDQWRKSDLVMIAKLVWLEVEINRIKASYADQEPLIPNFRGDLVENPMLGTIDKLQRQQLSIMRALSINDQPQSAQDSTRRAIEDQKAADSAEAAAGTGLIAA